jgi:hypothetical protein
MDETLLATSRSALHGVRAVMEGSIVMDERSEGMEGVAEHG